MAMTTREFIQHLILNCELDDPVCIEFRVPDNHNGKYVRMSPTHATRIGELDESSACETLIECKLWREY